MRKFFNHLALALVMLVAACGTLPGSTGVTTVSWNGVIANADIGVQAVQKASTASLRAKVINVAQDQLVQKQVDTVHAGLVLAQQMKLGIGMPADPVGAQKQLDDTLALLATLKKSTGVPND